MTGREIHQGPRSINAAHPGDKAASRPLQSRTDPPAPTRPAPAPSPLGAGAASTLAAWILDHARQDVLRGRPVPDAVADHVRDLLNPAPSPHGTKPATPATVELTTAQMARRMGCSERWVRHLCKGGKLRARRSGRDWLIAVEEEHEHDPERRHTG